jgi:lipopolysaccharide assembly LptE-like protein
LAARCLRIALLATGYWQLATACGYAPVRRSATHSVRVAPVRNDTAQAEAGGLFAAELRTELSGRGWLVGEASTAPELHAELVSLISFPTSAGSEGAAAYRLNADLRLKIGEYEDVLQIGEDYLAGIDVLGTEANRRAALRRLFRSAAREAIERYDVSERF